MLKRLDMDFSCLFMTEIFRVFDALTLISDDDEKFPHEKIITDYVSLRFPIE